MFEKIGTPLYPIFIVRHMIFNFLRSTYEIRFIYITRKNRQIILHLFALNTYKLFDYLIIEIVS